jgi:glutamine phosphoribosylpyrophosphate amidotransferase
VRRELRLVKDALLRPAAAASAMSRHEPIVDPLAIGPVRRATHGGAALRNGQPLVREV